MALHNCLDLTKKCLKSLQSTIPNGINYEVLIIDDCSTDGTREFLHTLEPPYRVFLNKTRQNYSKNNNYGAEMARGKLLILINNDLEFISGWLEPLLALHDRFPEAGCLGNIHLNPRTNLIDHAGVAFSPDGETFHRNKNRKRFPKGSCREVNAISTACMLIKRKTFIEHKGFDEAFINGSEDIDLCIRLKLSNYKIYVSNLSRVFHHVSSSPGRCKHDIANRELLRQKWEPIMLEWSRKEWPQAYLSRYARHFWKMRPKQFINAVGINS